MCGFCTAWMCGAFCNIVGVGMVGIVIVWVFWQWVTAFFDYPD